MGNNTFNEKETKPNSAEPPQKERVVVTGGAGFIGSHLVDELLSQGHEVVVVDDLSRGTLKNLSHCINRIEFIKVDLTEPGVAEKALQDCSTCYHLAAVVGDVRWMNTHPADVFKTIKIHYNVIEAARKLDTPKLIYTSSACTYPTGLQANADLPPLKEDDALNSGAAPDGDYGWAKLIGEVQCQSYHKQYGLKVAIIRPFNPYGPRESFDPRDSHVIPALIRRAINRENPFVVWGNGEQRRAFTFVTDLIEGIILASQKISDATPMNLGFDGDSSVREIAELVLKLTGYDTAITWDTTKPTGVSVRKSDMTKATQVLGWAPNITLMEGIRKTIEWYTWNKENN